MFNHGLTAPTLFCFVGFLEQRGGGLRGLDDFGGLRKVAPVFCGLMGIALFASLGLPGLNGFVGEFLIFKGVVPAGAWAAALSVIGLLVTAVFLLTLIQRVFNGPLNEKWRRSPDLTWREKADRPAGDRAHVPDRSLPASVDRECSTPPCCTGGSIDDSDANHAGLDHLHLLSGRCRADAAAARATPRIGARRRAAGGVGRAGSCAGVAGVCAGQPRRACRRSSRSPGLPALQHCSISSAADGISLTLVLLTGHRGGGRHSLLLEHRAPGRRNSSRSTWRSSAACMACS